MNNFPFFGFPYNNYYRYYNYRNNLNKNINHLNCNVEKVPSTCPSSKVNKHMEQNNNSRLTKNKSSKLYFGPIVFDSSSFSNLENPVLELLGLKLYLDDILIISLLYFLYEEDVKDETLFLSLLLLLIS